MADINLEQARHNMIEQQIRPWEVLDQRVLDTLNELPREAFMPSAYRDLALIDTELPLGGGAYTMTPKLEARLLQALAIEPYETVLEIGTGSGYLTALLAKLSRHVHSIEIDPTLLAAAAARLTAHGISNVTLQQGDGSGGWPDAAPFDLIAVTGSVPFDDGTLRQQLRRDGRLFMIVGNAPVMEAQLTTRISRDQFHTESLFETVVAPLQGVAAPSRFIF